ncbi:unnamed protein product [Ambrosiozyma monospora]|uniref:polynucleotide adenylyltransferase n=1 Tax=Ambrosiozyma monospora TaxID=43982 RepID=A0A9W6YW67_AMBMO|nr:unnamed protein product [Ambrosiozyma monospora]
MLKGRKTSKASGSGTPAVTSKKTKPSKVVKPSKPKKSKKNKQDKNNLKPKLKGKKARSRSQKSLEKQKKEDQEKSAVIPHTNSYGVLEMASDDDDEIINISDASNLDDDAEDDEDSDEYSLSEGKDGASDNDDIILIDSDQSDSESENSDDGNKSTSEKGNKQNEPNEHNDMSDNVDFIGFDVSSDEEEKTSKFDDDYDDADDNEYLSNDEGTYHTKSTSHKVGAKNSQYPWIRNNDHSKQIEISDWLTIEIKDFVQYISPAADEIKARNNCVERLRYHITQLWPDAELQCFGSYATDLYLPGSDIDMVVISKKRNGKYDNKSSLFQLSSYLRQNKLAINIETIAKAKVPIIKFVDPETQIHIDISFERTNGITAAELIISWIKTTPALRELVLIIKQFLDVRKLNVVHTGGLGGFATICLVYAFLKLHPRIVTNTINPMDNLGVLLIEFFELYGYNFGYDEVALAFKENGDPMYVSKRGNPDLMGRNPFLLAIQDPHDSSNNISRGTFNLRDVKRSFGGAFQLLVNKCYDMSTATYKQRLGQSILGDIIKFKVKRRVLTLMNTNTL